MQLWQDSKRGAAIRWPLFVALCLLPLIGGCGSTPLTAGSLLEQLLLGLILGSIYALIALGYTLVYGVIKLINFAHCDIYMIGAFLGYYLLRLSIRWLNFELGVPMIACFAISVVISSAACAVLAVIMERLAYRPLRKSTRIAALITAVGVSFFLENLGINVFGANPKSYEPKTLEIYQVQFAQNAEFTDAQQTEVRDATQLKLPAERFDSPQYARVRLIAAAGSGPWGPALQISSAKPADFIAPAPAAEAEAQADIGRNPSMALPSIGYATQEEHGRRFVVLSWAQGDSAFISVNPVFSSAEGRAYAFELPLSSAAGTPVRLPVVNIVIVVVTLLILWGLNVLVNRSTFGICMRALSFDMNAAKLMGVDTDRVISQTFAIGGACAGVAGNMVGLYNQTIEPLMGILPGMKAFIAAVVGGIGNIPGAAVGGLIMGVSEALVKGNVPPQVSAMADALAFAILILVLLFRPSGIFGQPMKEKV